MPRSISVRDRPNATRYASKLMHTRRNVTLDTRRISAWPIGIPISTPGTMYGRRPDDSCVSRPSHAYASSAHSDSIERTIARPTLKSSFASPWLFQNSASGGPEIDVRPYRLPPPAPSGTDDLSSPRIGHRQPDAWERFLGS